MSDESSRKVSDRDDHEYWKVDNVSIMERIERLLMATVKEYETGGPFMVQAETFIGFWREIGSVGMDEALLRFEHHSRKPMPNLKKTLRDIIDKEAVRFLDRIRKITSGHSKAEELALIIDVVCQEDVHSINVGRLGELILSFRNQKILAEYLFFADIIDPDFWSRD